MLELTGSYTAPTVLGSPLIAGHAVHAAISDRGTIRLEQQGRTLFLTPGELSALVALAGAR